MPKETIRSSWTLDGQRISLEYDKAKRVFILVTRWVWLAKFQVLQDACDAFEALEMLEGNPVELAKHLKTEIQRIPRHRCATNTHAMARVCGIVACVDMRLKGLRPVACGGKLSLTKWV